MAFSCSYMLSKVIQENSKESTIQSEKDIKHSKPLKRSCPFVSEPDNNNDNVLPEAVDVLDSIFSSLCPFTEDLIDGLEVSEKVHAQISVEEISKDYTCPEVIDISNDTLEAKDVLESELENEKSTDFDIFDFSRIPLQVTGCWKEFMKGNENNYTRGCKWAPDGSCVMSCSEDNVLRLFNLPPELWDSSMWLEMPEMEAVVKIAEGELIYDYCWYPHMNSTDPSTCCLASCSKNSPVHLWDGFTGKLRCSYRTYDQMDEIAPARSVSFDVDGHRIFCGFEKTIRIFNVDTPGRNFEERKTFAKKCGQTGIISCFAFTSANRSITAAGSYSKSIGIYSEPSGELECVLDGQKGGVTHLQFSPDGNLLYSGGRKDPEILCWDMRNLGSVLYCLRRSCLTNQRMYFDLSRCGRYVISGNHNGVVTIWDTLKEPLELQHDDFSVLEPVQFYLAHGDCVNGISIHPTLPLLCSSSGQRKFPDLLSEDEDEIFTKTVKEKDNSMRLWWIGKCNY